MNTTNRHSDSKRADKICLRIITVILTFVMMFTMVPWLEPEKGQAEASSYSGDYRYWNQSQSGYNDVREVGCLIVAQAKMIRESGIDTSSGFNPDRWFEWLANHGCLKNPGAHDLTMTNVAGVCDYAASKGKQLKYWGYWNASDSQLKFNLNAGYYTLINIRTWNSAYKCWNYHYVMMDNNTSKARNAVYVYDSWSSGSCNESRNFDSTYRNRGWEVCGGHVYQPIWVKPAPPSAPTNVKMSSSDIGIGDAIDASWSASSGADKYNVSLICTTNGAYNQSKSVSGTSVSFKADYPGKYRISVTASNSAGNSSAASSSNTTDVHQNCSVKYVDWEGKQIGAVQSVKYGGNATAPAAPAREGYTFQRWSSDGKKIRTDTTIVAEYKINTYMVSFVDYNGKVIGSEQKVEHGSAAVPPAIEDIPTKEGFVFSEWNTDEYKNVKKSLTVKAVYVWGNTDLPIITKVVSAKRNDEATGYDITVKLTNFPNDFTKGKLIAALKTKEGKMVASETASVSMPKTGETTVYMTILYSGLVSTVDVSMVGVVDDETTGTPKAKAVSSLVDVGNEWSDWSATVPEGDDLITESRTEYRYKDRKVIRQTTTPSTPSGYSLTSTANTGSYTSWGAWSGYSTAAVQKTNLCDVSTTTGYRYYAFRCANCGTRDPYSGACSNCGGRNMVWVQDFGTVTGQNYSGGYTRMDSNKGRIWWQNCYWYFEFPGTSDGQGGTGQPTTTLYRYRTRQEYKNYTYWRTDWTDWSPAVQTASDDKKVETRKTYRFKNNGTEVPCYNYKRYKFQNINTGKYVYSYTSSYADSMDYPGEWEYNTTYTELEKVKIDTGDDVDLYGGTGDSAWYRADANDEGELTVYVTKASREDNLGTKRIQEGSLEGCAGKVATLMVYKGNNEDPVASQIEFIGQTTVAEDGSYRFDYVTKEEPSAKTGDFIIALGIEGATNYIVLGKIEAPKPVYTVIFVDDEGNTIGEQKSVVSGGTVDAPKAPEKEGYEFIGWDTGLKNITENTVVTAQYKRKSFVVIFVDWDEKSLGAKEFLYGDVLNYETVPEREGKAFKRWLDESGEEPVTVKNNMIVTADYVDAVYTVQFQDWNGNTIREELLKYGDSAEVPEDLDAPSENQEFYRWDDTDGLIYVKSDMVVKPVARFTEDTDPPVITIENGTYTDPQNVVIYSPNADTVYYSVRPLKDALFVDAINESEFKQYKSSFVVNDDSAIFAYAESDSKNRSSVVIRTVIIGNEDDPAEDETAAKQAQAVVDLINNLPDASALTPDDKAAVENALRAYGELGNEARKMVPNEAVSKLNAAKDRMTELIPQNRDIRDFDVSIEFDSAYYTGDEIRPDVQIEGLSKYKDYLVEYSDNINAGRGVGIISGYGEYTGTELFYFTIEPVDINDCNKKLSLSKTKFIYSGKAVKPAVKTSLVQNKDFKAAYSGNTVIGTGSVTITGTGNYTGVKKLKFTIQPGKVIIKKVSPEKRKITVRFKTQKGGVKYQIRYRLGSGKWKEKTTSKKSLTIKSLKSKKKYAVRVRAYKKVKGKTYYGAWSKTKMVKVK